MKTLFLYETTSTLGKFFELEGDYSHLHRVLVNPYNCEQKRVEELSNIILDAQGNYKVTFFDKPTKDWDHFVQAGFLE